MIRSVSGKLAKNHKPAILIVDDDAQILGILRRLLELDFSIFTAESYNEALSVFEQHPEIDLVATDHRFDEEPNGTDLLRKVRETRPDVFRVMISGSIEEYHGAYLLLSGLAHDYIGKPWEFDDVHKVLTQRLLDRLGGSEVCSVGSGR